MGAQLMDAVDSADANIAEGEGRYHFRDKLKYLYQSRLDSIHLGLNGIISYRRKLLDNKS